MGKPSPRTASIPSLDAPQVAAAPRRVAPRLTPDVLAEIEAIAVSVGCELYHAEWKAGALRIFLDRREGLVTLADCESVSRQTSALLDVLDFGAGRYTLEVSSPGLDRELHRPTDYARFVGSLARVTFRNRESGHRKTVVGRLLEVELPDTQAAGSGHVTLSGDERRQENWTIPFVDIESARLEIEI